MSVIVTGLADIERALSSFLIDTEKAVDDAVRLTAIKVNNSAIKSIREPSIGELVTRYRSGGKPYSHIASSEGNTPNTDTGRLINSIGINHNKGSRVAYVGTNVDYGFFLETVMNRPWLNPALAKNIAGFKENMTAAIQMQIKKAKK